MEISKLLEQIINELIDNKISLSEILLKIKFLSIKLKNQTLKDWINNEIDGYREVNIPDYRIVECSVRGNYFVGRYGLRGIEYTSKEFQIPAEVLMQKNFYQLNLTQGISSIEYSLNSESSKSSILRVEIEPKWCKIIERDYRKHGNEITLHSLEQYFNRSIIKDILNRIRSKLLDLIVNIQEELGTDAQIDSLKMSSITPMINSTVSHIINTGDNNIFNTGNENQLSNKVNQSIQKDKHNLREMLKEANVHDNDIEELLNIIDVDNVHATSMENVGPSTKSWIKKMFDKSIDGTWKIAIGAAGGLLSKYIAGYLGF